MPNELKTEMHGNALVLTFFRPDRGNPLSVDMASQIFLALKNATTDRSIRAILLRGAGADFMNGLDYGIYGGSDFAKGIERNTELLLPYNSAIRELHVMEKPVLAAISGQVSGPGFSFMLASDLVLAARSTQITAGYTSFGMTPDGAATHYLPRKVGSAKAAEILMLNETMDAAAAEKLHLVNSVVDDDKLEAEALQWVDRLSQGPTRAFGGVKRLVAKSFENDINAQMALEHTIWGGSLRSFDFREAVRAHFAKRPVKYTGA